MATIAVFVALGGTSYAVVQLPRNSVGSKQVRKNAIGNSEIRSGAVRSKSIKDRSVALRDISLSTRNSLRGQAGPQGPPGPGVSSLAAAVTAGGAFARESGTVARSHLTEGLYKIAFNRDVSSCYALATISGSASGEISAEMSTAPGEQNYVYVFAKDTAGNLSDRPFHVVVVC
jgi:hypothetical protein